MIIAIMKDLERQGEENVRQGDIVERMVQRIELDPTNQGSTHTTSLERAQETSKKVHNVIQHLITNENLIMIAQDAKVKMDRYLTLNVNVDIDNI